MAEKIYINDNSVIVSDASSGAIIKDWSRHEIYYDSKLLEVNSKISLFFIKDGSPFYSTLLADAVNKTGESYTKTTFRQFCNEFLGKVNASSSEAKQEEIIDILTSSEQVLGAVLMSVDVNSQILELSKESLKYLKKIYNPE